MYSDEKKIIFGEDKAETNPDTVKRAIALNQYKIAHRIRDVIDTFDEYGIPFSEGNLTKIFEELRTLVNGWKSMENMLKEMKENRESTSTD